MMRLVSCPQCRTQFDGARTRLRTFRCPCGEMVPNVEHPPIDALIHRCSACGASVAASALRCDYCQGVVVRDRRQMGLICPECYARNPNGAKFCTSCGLAFSPQPLPSEGDPLVCPADGETHLLGRAIGGVMVHECPQCAGLWVPGAEFDRLVERVADATQARPSTGLSPEGPRRRWTGGERVRYRKCPCCGGVMVRKNFGGRSGVLVDWCGIDGTWLDADELEEIAAYILEGGLAERSDAESDAASSGAVARVDSAAIRILGESRTGETRVRSLGDLLAALLQR